MHQDIGDTSRIRTSATLRSVAAAVLGVSLRSRLPRLQRCDPARQPLVRTLVVIDLVEPVNLFLQLLEGLGEGLLVEPMEQRLVETFILALRGRFIGLARNRLDAESGDVGDEMADDSAA
jgi:hypothetical protein